MKTGLHDSYWTKRIAAEVSGFPSTTLGAQETPTAFAELCRGLA